MPIFGWALCGGLTLVAAVLGWLFGRGALQARLNLREEELKDERARADRLASDAARLPDAIARLGDAERRNSDLEIGMRTAAAESSRVNTQLDGSIAGTAALQSELSSLRNQFDAQQRDLHGSQLEAKASAARVEAVQAEANTLRSAVKDQELSLGQVRAELRSVSAELAKALAERDAARTLAEESKSYLQKAEAVLRTAFVEAASSVFDEKAAILDRKILSSSELSKQNLEATLKPFAENVISFQQKMELFSTNHTRDSAKLEGAITQLRDLNANMADATESLARALKGNAKVRGNWGEMILESVLKASGLEEGANYRKQDPSRDEDGKRHVPDVIVDLPDGRQVIIDSKVNLVDWANANSIEVSPEDYRDAISAHAAALRRHMMDLAEKNYPKIVGGQALELTVLFVPIEGALAAALSTDPTLQTDAFKKRIAFASPNTLMALLKVAERLWTRDRIQKQVENIRDEANKLLDSVTNFLVDFNKVDDKIVELSKVYASAKSRLHESRQSVLARAGRLVKAGARGNKELHPDLLEAVQDDLQGVATLPVLGDADAVDAER